MSRRTTAEATTRLSGAVEATNVQLRGVGIQHSRRRREAMVDGEGRAARACPRTDLERGRLGGQRCGEGPCGWIYGQRKVPEREAHYRAQFVERPFDLPERPPRVRAFVVADTRIRRPSGSAADMVPTASSKRGHPRILLRWPGVLMSLSRFIRVVRHGSQKPTDCRTRHVDAGRQLLVDTRIFPTKLLMPVRTATGGVLELQALLDDPFSVPLRRWRTASARQTTKITWRRPSVGGELAPGGRGDEEELRPG